MDGLDLCEFFWWTLPTCGGQSILCKSQFSGKFPKFFFPIPKKKVIKSQIIFICKKNVQTVIQKNLTNN
jgi:hypothetical protein